MSKILKTPNLAQNGSIFTIKHPDGLVTQVEAENAKEALEKANVFFEKQKDSQKDLNKDGNFDEKDLSIAGEVLNEGKKIKQ